jgi:hypothetical protein
MALPPRVGGSFAPPLTDETLARYRAVIDGLDERSPVRGAMADLLACAAAWWAQPESTGAGRPHGSGRGTVVSLDPAVADALWDAVPWPHECDAMQALFDGLAPGEVRDAAFHLLWFAKELTQDREPISADKL